MDKIHPHPTVRYTKPLYVLIDEKCASCADIFPALMKDNNRATLLGRTTSGAGGMIETLPITNAFGVESLSLTSSLLLRNNMMVIEDVGISPHFEHKKTVQSAINSNQEKMQAIDFAARDIASKKKK
jgi:C-terminal processing protease CtpA/Prc